MLASWGENFVTDIWRNFLLLLPMVFLFIAGNVLRVSGFFKAQEMTAISKLLFWVILPALLFRSSFGAGSQLLQIPPVLLGFLACAFAASLIAFILAYFRRGEKNMLRVAVSTAAATRPNSILLGAPMALLILGEESLLYVSLFAASAMPLHNIVSPVFAEIVSAHGESPVSLARKSLLGAAKNPVVCSSLAGLFLAMTGVGAIPAPIDKALHFLGVCATGISLLALGASLEPGKIFTSIAVGWRDVAVRLIIHPALVWLWFLAFPAEKALVQTIVLMTAMPTAVTLFVLSEGMRLDSEYAAQVTVATTMLSVLTIPIWAIILAV